MSRFLLLSNTALVLLPMLTLGSLGFTLVDSHYRSETTITVRSIMLSVAAESARYIDDTRRLVERMAERFADIGPSVSESDLSALETAQETLRGIRSVLVLKNDLRVAAAVPKGLESIGDDYSRRPFIRDLDKSVTVLSMPFINPDTGNVNVAVARKKGNAVVVAFLDLDALSDFLKALRFSPKDEAALADGTGAFIAHTDRRLVRERTRETLHAELRAAGGVSLRDKKTETREFLAAGIPVSGTPWTVLYYRDYQDAYALMKELSSRFLIALVVLASAAIISAVLSHRAFSVRLAALISYIGKIEVEGLPNEPSYKDDPWREFRDIGSAFTEMAERIREREAELKKSEDQYRGLFLHNKAITLIIDFETGRILDANPAAVEYYHFSRDQLLALQAGGLTAVGDEEERAERRAAEEEKRNHFHSRHRLSSGEIRDVETYESPVEWDGKSAVYTIVIDTTERRIAEEKLAKSLAEKSVLLREIHHRVKNNLQIMSSLLNLQSRYVHNQEDEALFVSSQDRIRSMALIHELIYQRENLSSVDLEEYASILVRHFLDGAAHVGAEIRLDCVSVMTSPDVALPFGLILNELITNSVKYAFPPQRRRESGCRIDIRLRAGEDRRYELEYSDDGVGLPKDIDPEKTDSLGFSLVRSLSAQLGAKRVFRPAPGFGVSVVFSIPES